MLLLVEIKGASMATEAGIGTLGPKDCSAVIARDVAFLKRRQTFRTRPVVTFAGTVSIRAPIGVIRLPAILTATILSSEGP